MNWPESIVFALAIAVFAALFAITWLAFVTLLTCIPFSLIQSNELN
jgi:hypothetical protein